MNRLAALWRAFLGNEVDGGPPERATTDPVLLGEEAKRLLNDPVLGLALDRIKAKLATAFMGSKVGDTEAREAAYRLNWAVKELETELHIMVGRAQIIEAEQKAAAQARR